jgi:hypothetical protein
MTQMEPLKPELDVFLLCFQSPSTEQGLSLSLLLTSVTTNGTFALFVLRCKSEVVAVDV